MHLREGSTAIRRGNPRRLGEARLSLWHWRPVLRAGTFAHQPILRWRNSALHRRPTFARAPNLNSHMMHAEMEATNVCDTRCIHCPHDAMTRPRGQMAWSTFETIAGKLREHANGEKFSVSFSGMGEPLLNPLLADFISAISASACTSFATNGLTLDDEIIQTLIDAGLDYIYVSFNGDEPILFSKMTGGLPYETVLRNIRRAVALAKGRRLKVCANVSVTKPNRDRLVNIRSILESAGVQNITFSMGHSRGDNLKDPEIVDTPICSDLDGKCEVLRNTLFIDWRGQVLPCSHDLKGEHVYGDLTQDRLSTVLERRDQMLAEGLTFGICRNCNDLLRVGFYPLPGDAGGPLSEWIFDIYKNPPGYHAAATAALKWLYKICVQNGRGELLVEKLAQVEQDLQVVLANTRLELNRRSQRVGELDRLIRDELATKDTWIEKLNLQRYAESQRKDRCISELQGKLAASERTIHRMRDTMTWKLRHKLLSMWGGSKD